VERSETLEGGELRAYQFSLTPGSLALQATLENRVGNPVMALRMGNRFPNPGIGSVFVSQPGWVTLDEYGHEGGDAVTSLDGNANQLLLTLPNATNSTFRLVVKARASSPNTYPNSSYTLRVQAAPVPPLNFSADLNTNGASHTATGVLADNQRAYYRVDIPPLHQGRPVLGWRLDLSQSQGTAAVGGGVDMPHHPPGQALGGLARQPARDRRHRVAGLDHELRGDCTRFPDQRHLVRRSPGIGLHTLYDHQPARPAGTPRLGDAGARAAGHHSGPQRALLRRHRD